MDKLKGYTNEQRTLYLKILNQIHFCNLDKQHDPVEELNIGYFTQGKYIGDQKFLLESAAKVGIEGAEEYLKHPNNGLKEVVEEPKTYSRNINGVPYYVLSNGQPPEVFLRAFEVATS